MGISLLRFAVCSTNVSSGVSTPYAKSSNLMSYLAYSAAPNHDYDACFDLLESRTPWDQVNIHLGIDARETTIFQVRFDLIANNNKAYNLAMKDDPTAKELGMFAGVKALFSTIYPVKAYLQDHLDVAKEYRGFMPFGKDVIKFFNQYCEDVNEPDWKVSGQPDYRDHSHLMRVTNFLADTMNTTTLAINTLMYLEGQKMA